MKRFALCILLALAATGASFGGTHAPSFDCAKAATKAEKLICADSSLSRFDEQLDATYRNGLSRSASPDAFRAAQHNWLKSQRDACGNLACLQRAYAARVDMLANESTANPSTDTLELSATRSRVAYAAPKASCDGFPRPNIGMAKGYCAGLMAGPTQADPQRRMRLPRTLLQLAARTCTDRVPTTGEASWSTTQRASQPERPDHGGAAHWPDRAEGFDHFHQFDPVRQIRPGHRPESDAGICGQWFAYRVRPDRLRAPRVVHPASPFGRTARSTRAAPAY